MQGFAILLGRAEQPPFYPLGVFDGLYTPDLPVLRDTESQGYGFLPRNSQATHTATPAISFVAVAALQNPPLIDGRRSGEKILSAEARSVTMEKIRTIGRIAHAHGHNALVLSAFGVQALYPTEVTQANTMLSLCRLWRLWQSSC